MIATTSAEVKPPNNDASLMSSDVGHRKKTRYTQLNTFEDEQDQVNLYAVVIDASYPYQSSGKFITTLKVIDASCHTKGDEVT